MQTQIFHPHFKKGDAVEIIKPNTNLFYPASVLRAPAKQKNLVFVEYLTLFVNSSSSDDGGSPEPPKCLREYTNVANVRPKLPQELNLWFKIGDCVDAYLESENAWCIGTVTDILENSKYLVKFEGRKRDSVVIEQCSLRLHRKWVDGIWVPPLPEKEKPPDIETKPRNLRLKIKCCRKLHQESKFKKGSIVEVTSDDEGYKGAWFISTIVGLIGKDKFLVEYRDLMTDDETDLLKEEINARLVRPCPPEVPGAVSFKQLQEVDAWYNDGWWEGVVLEVLNSREYLVSFIHNDVLKFQNSDLRPHQDWLDGKWVMSSKKSSELAKKFGDVMLKIQNFTGNTLSLKCPKSREHAKMLRDVTSKTKKPGRKFMLHFCKGEKVEVRSDEEGYQGAWYAAIIVGFLQNRKYLVEYLTLKTDDLTEQLKEEADASDVRPSPPEINHCHRFALHERVDAWYNDGWWVGHVSSVLRYFKYRVYFPPTKEELEFEHCHLRSHQDWSHGRWVLASLD